MAATPGLDYINSVLAFVTAIILFAAAGFSMFIRMKVPQQRYSIIFPYLTVGMLLLGFMMVSYSIIFMTHKDVVVPVPTLLFIIGTASMMYGAYKVTEELGLEEARRARLKAKASAARPSAERASQGTDKKARPGA